MTYAIENVCETLALLLVSPSENHELDYHDDRE